MKLTGKQSRAARALLKWNLHDLAAKVRTPPKRIESFEKGVIHLQKSENEELVDAYKKEGIEFKGDFDVKLREKTSERNVGSGVGAQITLMSHDLVELPLGTMDEPDEETARALRQKPR